MAELSALMDDAQFRCFCVVIDKDNVPQKFKAYDPYHISLSRGFRLITDYLRLVAPEELEKELHIVFEMRGRDDDASVSSAYQQIVLQGSLLGVSPSYDFRNFRLELMDKKSNSTDLQIADLTARPIGNHYLHKLGRTKQADLRAAEIVMKKLLHCTPAGCFEGKYDVFHQTL
ncbi:Protein of unknown function [Loktanella fryxellensis]|uniref:DUF3800 domain-containing protein n=2 Tax=Loktanella fryxellensis TaxID=245187 RepID=A0A1H8JMF8_9RHOB|nr:Protein of unknown function [Loktanella fryxellensis]